jgi:hypothetical protein
MSTPKPATRREAGGGQRHIPIKAEVVYGEGKEPKDNPRFVIANMKQTLQWLYEKVYCQRGEIENRIEELHALPAFRQVSLALGALPG